jgi:hypothetical protein
MAKRIGAVNTLVRTADNSGFKGYNTDDFGIKKSFEEASCSLKDESVIILGAGGAARPAAFLCADEGAKEVFILNRTQERAQELSDSVNDFAGKKLCSAMKLSDYKELDASKKYICFQATSVGLYPESDEVIIDDENFYKLVLTSDHGNIEEMVNEDGTPNKGHTANPVPFIIRDKNVKLTVTTGLEALGRSSDLNKLVTFLDIMTKIAPALQQLGGKVEKVANDVAASLNLDIDGMFYSEEERQEQAQAMQQQELLKTVAPNAVNKYGDMLLKQQEQEQENS